MAVDRQGFEAREAADFYSTHPITIFIGSSPGGGYSVYSRILARHLPRHIPGEPRIELQHVGEQAGIVLCGRLANALPRDGSAIAAIRSANAVESVLNPGPEVKFDARTFEWIGCVSRQNGTIVTWKTSGFKTFEQLRERRAIAGAETPFSNVGTLPGILNGLFGTRFITKSGYDRKSLKRALECGEIDAICGLGYNTLLAAHSDWLEAGALNILAHTGLERDPLLPGVPCTIEFAKSEDDRNVVRMMDYRQALGRPYAAPPNVHAGRLAVLRKAFSATMNDDAFVEEAKEAHMLIDPLDHRQMSSVVDAAAAMPPHVIARTRNLVAGTTD